MEFIALKVVDEEIEVEIKVGYIESEVKIWDIALILYVLRADLSMNIIKQFMIKNYNFVTMPNMYDHDKGYFFLIFKSYKKRDEVMMKRPYTIRNMPLLLHE